MKKIIAYFFLTLWIVIALYIWQYLIRYGSTNADRASALIVARQEFLGRPLRQFILSVPTVKDCSFEGYADLPFLTDEAIIRAKTRFGETNTVEMTFMLLGREVYPASPRTKHFIDQAVIHRRTNRMPDMATLLEGAPKNDGLYWPEPLGAKPIGSVLAK